MEELTASEVRTRSFDVSVRGFDRGEVERYLEQVADYLEALQQQLHQAGITDLASPADLAGEYAAVGDEVAAVLAEARAAADSMRSRAATDVARWRTEAEAETQQMRDDTEAAVAEARESVWVTGSEMLDQVVAECQTLLAEARESSLRIRSEAERDSARMVTDSQREREELLRAGRDEAERMVSGARKESDVLVTGARQQADAAHQRARALEERRAELMEELESAQKALLGIEEEPPPPEASDDEPETTPDTTPTRTHWPEDAGGVRIVTARPAAVPAEPVDADTMAAEVEALRGRQPVAASPYAGAPSASLHPELPPNGEETPEPEPEQDLEPEPDAEAVSPLSGESPATVEEEGSPSERASEAEAEVAPEPEPEPDDEPGPDRGPDPLAGLFDELRGNGSRQSDNGASREGALIGSASVVTLVAESSATPEPTGDSPFPTRDSLDPFALRDRLLLPVQNRALRLVKRQFVAAQNRALEELRLDPEWMPQRDLINGEIGGVLVDLISESTAAGFAAAGELLGRSDPPRPELGIEDPTEDFVGAFVEAAGLSLERSRSAGAGKRETASSLSRVFRAWRTDDAERRVRFLSRTAYHGGVLAALLEMDCERVLVSPSGSSCVDHGEGTGPWQIPDGPPAGTLVPPASLECSCTIVPDC